MAIGSTIEIKSTSQLCFLSLKRSYGLWSKITKAVWRKNHTTNRRQVNFKSEEVSDLRRTLWSSSAGSGLESETSITDWKKLILKTWRGRLNYKSKRVWLKVRTRITINVEIIQQLISMRLSWLKRLKTGHWGPWLVLKKATNQIKSMKV